MEDSGADPALAKAEPVSRLGPSGFDPGELPPQCAMGGDWRFVRREIVDWFENPQGVITSEGWVMRQRTGA